MQKVSTKGIWLTFSLRRRVRGGFSPPSLWQVDANLTEQLQDALTLRSISFI
jgi:hypothetical protein